MSISPRRPPRHPLISRRFEPSRLQHDSLVSAYSSLLPTISRRLGISPGHPGRPERVKARRGPLKSSVGGA
jgi:hypothetical protein